MIDIYLIPDCSELEPDSYDGDGNHNNNSWLYTKIEEFYRDKLYDDDDNE